MTYPAHIRKKILAELENSTYREVAARHRISPNTLATWKKQPQPKGSRRSMPRLLTEEVIRQDVAEHPDDYQWERAARLGCSQNGICKALKRYRFTVKKKDFRHRKADEEKRHEFLEVKSVYEERLHPFVYIDESGFRKDISRPYGYAPRGQKCAGVSGWGKAQTNVIGALCGTVPFAFTAFDCSIDSDVFHTWVTKILLPELPACSVIVMDNAPFHKRQDTLDALQAEGHTVLWLPPYSPDFNPIEKTWAWIKRLRKQWRLADVNALLFWFFILVTLC